ncbi:hypothetical protein SLA2020_431700 [Shorea laevis]
MGQKLSCRQSQESTFFSAVQNGVLEIVQAIVVADPNVLEKIAGSVRLSAPLVTAVYGQIEVCLVHIV